MATKLKAVLCCLIIVVLFSTAPASATPAETFSMTTVSFPSTNLRGIGVYETGNKVFVGDITDTFYQKIHVLDGTSHEILTTIEGLSAWDGGRIIVNETYGRVFYYTREGIGMIDAVQNTLINEDIPYGRMVHDEVYDRLFIIDGNAAEYSVSIYDIASGELTPLSSGEGNLKGAVYNHISNELGLVSYYPAKLIFIDASSGVTDSYDITESGGNHAVDLEVNPNKNKYYTTLISVPGQGEMGIAIYDRDSGIIKYVGEDDLEPLVFNPASNTLFSGVQVGTTMGIVDGETDEFFLVNVFGNNFGGHAAGAVRYSSDHAYFTSTSKIAILDGLYNTVDFINLPVESEGGGVFSSIDINQLTGQVYVIPHQEGGKMFVLQDIPGEGTGVLFQDTGFEAASPNPVWRVWGSNDKVYPVQCDLTLCDEYGQHSGSQWAQLGGYNWLSAVSQTGVIPVEMKSLTFWLRKPNDVPWSWGDELGVIIDRKEILFYMDGETSGYSDYKKVSLDIAKYADGKTHRIEFFAVSDADINNPGTYFLIDDVALDSSSPPVTNTPQATNTLPPTHTAQPSSTPRQTVTPVRTQTAVPSATVTAGPALDEHIYLPMGIRNWVGE